MNKVKIGHIGLGDIAVMRYLPCYGKDNLVLNAICTRNEQKLKKFAEKLGVKQHYTNHKEMLQKADIDAVVITTPTPSHYQITMDCIKAGKHVLIEKPLTTKLKEADVMISEASRKGIKFMVLPYDDVESLKEIRAQLKDILIGNILNVEAVLIGNGVFHTDWFYQSGSGELNDFAIYPISWLTGLLGSAREVVAFASTRVSERKLTNNQIVKNTVEDTSSIMLKWENGVLGTISSNWCTNGLGQFFKNDVWRGNSVYYANVYGTDGLIHCDFGLNSIITVAEGKIKDKDKNSSFENLKGLKKEWSVSEPSADTWGGVEILRDFADSILNDREVVTRHGHVKHVIEIIEKSYKSIETGKVQKLETSF